MGAAAGALGIALQTLPLNALPFMNRIADLVAHVSLLNYSPALGLGEPAYDSAPNPNLGIVTVDDATYKKMGFPFPRAIYKTFLNKLRAAGAKTVVFDIDFIESHPAEDEAFASAMRELPTVLGYLITTTSAGRIGEQLPAPTLRPYAAAIGFTSFDSPGGYLLGMPVEIDTAQGGEHGNERLFSLPVQAVATYERRAVDTSKIPMFNEGPSDRVMLLLPPKTEHHLDLASGSDQFNPPAFAGRGVMSFADAYGGRPADLRPFANGALIYVGATAQGTFDFSTTAGRNRAPGLFINARLADQIMRGYYLRVAPFGTDVALTLVLPLLAALSFSLMRTPAAIVVSLAATVAYAYLNLYFFIVRLYWLDLVHVVLAMLLGTMFVAIYRVLNEGSQRRMVTNLFGMHVSPAVVADILKQDDPRGALALRGKRVKATIFYSDIRGFTAMSETMTPEEIYGQLNEYFEEMCKIIFEHGGYVDKFIGDCVMAVFSAPYQTPEDARNAVISAVKQQEKIRELAARWKANGKREFTVGMGINTGDVVMGNLGASSRMNYTVIGDNVNVAARLYNVAKGGEIIISETTYAECKDIVEVDGREPISVKGKSLPIAIYNVKSLVLQPV
jgi:class 3 adenylate cyclase/CHASE2 domain-containing sensor protein